MKSALFNMSTLWLEPVPDSQCQGHGDLSTNLSAKSLTLLYQPGVALQLCPSSHRNVLPRRTPVRIHSVQVFSSAVHRQVGWSSLPLPPLLVRRSCSFIRFPSLQGHKKTAAISAAVMLLFFSGLTLPILIRPKRCPHLI